MYEYHLCLTFPVTFKAVALYYDPGFGNFGNYNAWTLFVASRKQGNQANYMLDFVPTKYSLQNTYNTYKT